MYDNYKVITIRSKAFDRILANSGINPEFHPKLITAFEIKHDEDFYGNLPDGCLDERGWPTEQACLGVGVHDIVLPDCEGHEMHAKIIGYCFPRGDTMFRVRRFIDEHEEQGVINTHKAHLIAAGMDVR